jgi:hypothetical protein
MADAPKADEKPAETTPQATDTPVGQDMPGFLREPHALNESEPEEENKDEEKKDEKEEKEPEKDEEKKDEKEEQETDDKKKEEDSKKSEEQDKKDEKKDEEEKPEKKDEQKPDTGDKKEEKPPEKNKEVEDLKAELASVKAALEKVTKSADDKKDEKKKEEDKSDFEKKLEMFKTTPVIQASQPSIDKYKLEDGSYDIDSYMNDRERNLVLAIQKSLVGGPLASAQFQILQQAINEESSKRLETSARDEQTTTIQTKLEEKFPRLKSDEQLQDLFASKVYAEKQRRFEEAGKDPNKYEDPTYEDYEKLLGQLIAYVSPTQTDKKQEEEKTEKLRGTPPLTPNSEQKDPVSKDIEEMKEIKGSSKFF